ncbi:hypothetical protein C3L33_17145, partial [Rhododendron williamsianum]
MLPLRKLGYLVTTASASRSAPSSVFSCSIKISQPDGLSNPLRSFSSVAGTILVQARDIGRISMELENAVEEHRFDDAGNLRWLEKAYGLVEQAIEEGKQNLLEKETLIYLAFCLARCGLVVPGSTVLRKLVEMEQFPPVSAWSAILAHMSQTAPGAYLAAELVTEIGYLFQDGRVDPRKKINAPLIAMKPNTTAFNIALAGCLLFHTTRKAEQLLDMMPRIGVKVDTTLLVIMAHIYERNGRREELKKLKRHIDEAPDLSDVQFRQFYNCLLTCHLNFGDLEAASYMVLEMLRKAKEAQNSLAAATMVFEASGSGNQSSPEQAEAKELLGILLVKLLRQVDLITTERGILQPTERIYVKLVKGFLEVGKTKDLAEFLIKAEKEDSPASTDDSVLVHVINSCILLGWLDQAHDLLDEMPWLVLKLDLLCWDPIRFKLLRDEELGTSPKCSNFPFYGHRVCCYRGKYTEVTELWGEMKSFASATAMKFDQELLDSVLYTFVRGGFFSRANEVVEMMERQSMFIDKYKYRTLFLKYHKTLYKGKAPKVQSEAQLKKREAGLTFKKWVGLCVNNSCKDKGKEKFKARESSEGGKVLLNHSRKEDIAGSRVNCILGGRTDGDPSCKDEMKFYWWEWEGVEIVKRDLEGLFESVAALIDGYGNELLQFTDIGRRCPQAFINMLA